ncbi:Target of rapamycin complex subunit lst8 [Echinococcus granulosus]|nr:Target of rapamycin complex subunit lst8 [Echinococcus granulosus]
MKDDVGDQSISFATGGFDHIIRMWQPSTGRYIQGFDHNDSQVNSLAFTFDGHYLAAAGFRKIRIYDVFGGATPLTVVTEFSKNVNAIGHDARGRWTYAGGEDKVAKIFDWRSSSHSAQSASGTCYSSSSINSMVLHPNQMEVLFSNDKGEIYAWDLRNGQVSVICPDPRAGPIHSISISAEGTSLAAVNASGSIITWSLAGNTAFKPTEKHNSKIHSSYALKCEFSPDSTLLATCGADGKVNLVRTADCSVTSVLQPNEDRYWAWDCAFSADSRYLISAHSDGIARLWNLEDSQQRGQSLGGTTTEPRLEYKGHQRAITCIAFRDQSLAGSTA